MRIVCPVCAAAYQVPDSLLGSEPRPVRCARCANEWTPDAATGAAPGPAPTPPRQVDAATDENEPTLATVLAEATSVPEPAALATSPEAASEPPGVPVAPPPPDNGRLAMASPLAERWPPRTGRAVAQFGWAASVLLLVAMLGAVYLLRAQVQAAWPPSQRAYSALGLH